VAIGPGKGATVAMERGGRIIPALIDQVDKRWRAGIAGGQRPGAEVLAERLRRFHHRGGDCANIIFFNPCVLDRTG
jgi:hypothetical protein